VICLIRRSGGSGCVYNGRNARSVKINLGQVSFMPDDRAARRLQDPSGRSIAIWRGGLAVRIIDDKYLNSLRIKNSRGLVWRMGDDGSIGNLVVWAATCQAETVPHSRFLLGVIGIKGRNQA